MDFLRIRPGLRAALLLLLAFLALPAAAAGPSNPRLTALVGGVDDEDNRRDTLRIERLGLEVQVHGGIADTILTARIFNGGGEQVEADFALALPPGSTVTGYALDVEGNLVDGVLVDQRKARQAYQERVRQAVDPGLGEVLRGYQFRTRINPVLPGGRRTVQIHFATPLDPRLGYVLPLTGGGTVGELDVAVEASGLSREPAVSLPDGGPARSERRSGTWRFSYSATQVRLGGDLTVSGVERSSPLLASHRPNGDPYFELSDRGDVGLRPGRPRSVAILWDRSLSRADDALAAEAALLEAYLERARPDRIELVFFDASLVERVAVATPEAAAAAVAGLRYRGASSFTMLSKQPVEAEACLLFSDGLVTIDRRNSFRPACPVFAVSSAPDSDRDWLTATAQASGGLALQLTSGNSEDILDQLGGSAPRVLAVRTAAGAPIDFTLLNSPDKGWRLIGPLPSSRSVVVRLAGPEGRPIERVYATGEGEAPRLNGAGALWASHRLAMKAANDDSDRDDIVGFARRHRVAGPDVSFIVLERPADYARAGIEPPLVYAASQRAEFDRLLARKLTDERKRQQDRLKTVLEAWEDQKAWWEKRFDPNARPNKAKDQAPPPPVPAPAPPPQPVTAEEPSPDPLELPGIEGSADEASEGADITVTGSRLSNPNLNSYSPVTSIGGAEFFQRGNGEPEPAKAEIELPEWTADRPYLKALAAAPASDLESVLAREQAEHGALPAFWLDVSDWYLRAGRKPEALRLLLSALDLPTRNSETVAVVAERLVRWGELDRAVAAPRAPGRGRIRPPAAPSQPRSGPREARRSRTQAAVAGGPRPSHRPSDPDRDDGLGR